VRELQPEYADRVTFTIIPAEETARSPEALEEYGFTDQKHGLVIFSANGEAQVKIPGHQFGRKEITAGIKQVLTQ
jgi:hypothetical protein